MDVDNKERMFMIKESEIKGLHIQLGEGIFKFVSPIINKLANLPEIKIKQVEEEKKVNNGEEVTE
jgi:hypothetical protein